MLSPNALCLPACAGLAAIAGAIAPLAAEAADYPTASIKVIVPFPPGGSSDLTARLLAMHLGERFKQTVVIENRPGGEGMIGPTLAARAKPDGYTLLLGAPTLVTARATMKSLAIQPIGDLEGVSQLIESPNVVVINARLPATDLRGFIDYTKANPGKTFYGTYSPTGQLTYHLLRMRTGIDLTQVAFKGEALTVSAIVANEVQAGFVTTVTAVPRVKEGTVKALAVTANRRLPSLPDAPSAEEAGVPGFHVATWFGILAPRGTPLQIKTKLADEIAVFAKRPDTIEKLRVVGFEPKASTPDEFDRFLAASEKQWLGVAKAAGITPQ